MGGVFFKKRNHLSCGVIFSDVNIICAYMFRVGKTETRAAEVSFKVSF